MKAYRNGELVDLTDEEQAAFEAERVALRTPLMVKMVASHLIVSRYPEYKQLNIIREGGPALATMSAFIDAIRAKSNEIEAMSPIPEDYADPARWEV